MSNPKVTVLMPVYNAEKYVGEAIQSILNQTFTDFEFLIINDGSTDSSLDIILSYTDSRIKVFNSNLNYGHVYHLNCGIEIAKGEYIARMDADDISLLNRLEKQVAFMDENPDIGVCGTWYEIIGGQDSVKHSIDDVNIRLDLLTHSALGHPTVILRTQILIQFNLRYDPLWVPAEDYWFWIELSRHCKLANLPHILLQYRTHHAQISSRCRHDQRQKVELIRNRQIEILLNRKLTAEEKNYHRLLLQEQEINDIDIDIDYFVNLKFWVNTLVAANLSSERYSSTKISSILTSKLNGVYRSLYFKQIRMNRFYSLSVLIDFWFSKNQPFLYFNNKERLKFTIKCLVGYPIYKSTSYQDS